MLVLSRHLNQSIVVETPSGEIIKFRPYTVSPQTGQLKIAIEAPDNFRIDREEIYLERKREGKNVKRK